MMKGDITRKVLEKIEGIAVDITDLFDVFLSARYGSGIGTFNDKLAQRKTRRSKKNSEIELARYQKQQYYNLLSRLKRDSLIDERTKNNKKLFSITERGEKKLSVLRGREELPKISYEGEKTSVFTIIVFDIPERERRKRDWLRIALRNLGFSMIQKSVWIGRIKVPKDFLYDIGRLRILNYLHIFEVSKKGSLVRAV